MAKSVPRLACRGLLFSPAGAQEMAFSVIGGNGDFHRRHFGAGRPNLQAFACWRVMKHRPRLAAIMKY